MEWIASAAFGLEGLVARDLKRLGIEKPAPQTTGGVRFEADFAQAFAAICGCAPRTGCSWCAAALRPCPLRRCFRALRPCHGKNGFLKTAAFRCAPIAPARA